MNKLGSSGLLKSDGHEICAGDDEKSVESDVIEAE